MGGTLTHRLIETHLDGGDLPEPGAQIALKIDQTLTQDATGTLVMLALEELGLDRVRTDVSVQYVDHNLMQADAKNADDHLFLKSACARFGVRYSPPGTGVSHPLHMKYFGKPGATLLGSDSHTPAAGALGMLAIGAGGIDVALAMGGTPFAFTMPEVWGIRLTGDLPDWVSAKDVILELLRRHGVQKGRGRILEYHGPGVASLEVMDRHVIDNMGTELGATSSVFPADDQVRGFLDRHGRGGDWQALEARADCTFDHEDEIDLGALVPLIAKPSSPGNVVPVEQVAGAPIYQAYIGSSANPGFRDFAVVAEIMKQGGGAAPGVSLDINPTSRDVLHDLLAGGRYGALLEAGARIHQAGCNGCIGMGQAPATGRNSLRTVPRNFPDRSGTAEDSVFLCSPETAAASALRGEITDPRDLGQDYPRIAPPDRPHVDPGQFIHPLPPAEAREVTLVTGPNIGEMPVLDGIEDNLDLPVLLKLGDDISTDEIMPAGTEILPYRSNIPEIANFVFRVIDKGYPDRARQVQAEDGHAIVAEENYGQGSSREHAAVAPRCLGLRAVLARSFARIHTQNLINYGILPLVIESADDLARLEQGTTVRLRGIRDALRDGTAFAAETGDGAAIRFANGLSARQAEIVLAGGIIGWCRQG